MNTLARTEILKLPLSERIKLVKDIWDSIAECPEAIQLTDVQKVELDNRFEEYQRNPNSGSPWALVREKFLKLQ
jgi:putative addiction module component (TIGR02574 family)